MRNAAASISCGRGRVGSGVAVRSVLRTGRIFDTPPLGRALQSAFGALGLLIEFKPLSKSRALCGALGLLEQEMLC